jgi:hypothetical protein
MPTQGGPTIGVFERKPADWYIDTLASAHFDQVSGGGFARVSLYNNATDGTVLGLVGWMLLKSSTSNNFHFVISRGTLDTFQVAGSANDPQDAAPWGALYGGLAAGAPPNTATMFSFGAAQLGASRRTSRPWFALTPGYSLSAWMDATGIGVCVGFHWCEIPTP